MLLGRYKTLIPVGRGGMSDVYIGTVAEPEDPKRAPELVILKQMRVGAPVDLKSGPRFEEEVAIALMLDHPNVVRGLGRGEADGRPFIVLEYVDGQPIDQLIRAAKAEKANGHHEELRACLPWILAEALAGLHYAHNLSIEGRPMELVHRDFNPQNLVVDYSGSVKVLDFGIAKTAQHLVRTTTGIIKGKLRYMAPEQALEMRIDRRADVFSAGVMLWEFLSGTPFWGQRSDHETFDDLVGGVYATTVPSASPGMNAVLQRALARAASDRYPTADAMRSDLLAEIERTSSRETFKGKTAAVVNTLFAERRERMGKLIASALANAL
jgi:eukaryotic-like serine/threonine-protein kinase